MITDYENIKLGKDLSIDLTNKTIFIRTKMYDMVVYSFIKELWRYSDEHIKYEFPFVFGHSLMVTYETGWKVYGMSKLVFYNKDFVYKELNYSQLNNII